MKAATRRVILTAAVLLGAGAAGQNSAAFASEHPPKRRSTDRGVAPNRDSVGSHHRRRAETPHDSAPARGAQARQLVANRCDVTLDGLIARLELRPGSPSGARKPNPSPARCRARRRPDDRRGETGDEPGRKSPSGSAAPTTTGRFPLTDHDKLVVMEEALAAGRQENASSGNASFDTTTVRDTAPTSSPPVVVESGTVVHGPGRKEEFWSARPFAGLRVTMPPDRLHEVAQRLKERTTNASLMAAVTELRAEAQGSSRSPLVATVELLAMTDSDPDGLKPGQLAAHPRLTVGFSASGDPFPDLAERVLAYVEHQKTLLRAGGQASPGAKPLAPDGVPRPSRAGNAPVDLDLASWEPTYRAKPH